jgi:predicted MFS family arabinose efflux permease
MMTVSSSPASGSSTRPRLPLAVYVLGAGAFLVGTSELLVAGLLPQVARDFDIGIPQAGSMITVFAIGSIIGPPVTILFTLRLPRRMILALSLVVFALGQVVVALSTDLTLTLVARFVAAVVTGAFWALAAVVAADIAGPGARSRAIGLVVAGGTIANVVGVPLGSVAGQLAGWREPFWALAAVAALAALGVTRLVPHTSHGADGPPRIRTELAVLRSGRLWLVLLTCAFVTGGTLSIYSYIAPLLTLRAGLPESALPLAFLGFGVCSVIGTVTAGRLGDHHPFATIAIAAAISLAIIVTMGVTSNLPIPTLALFGLLGLTGASINPVLMALALRFGHAGPTLASSLGPSAFNVGIAACTGITAAAFDTALGTLAPIAVGAVGAALVLLLAIGMAAVAHRPEPAGA